MIDDDESSARATAGFGRCKQVLRRSTRTKRKKEWLVEEKEVGSGQSIRIECLILAIQQGYGGAGKVITFLHI